MNKIKFKVFSNNLLVVQSQDPEIKILDKQTNKVKTGIMGCRVQIRGKKDEEMEYFEDWEGIKNISLIGHLHIIFTRQCFILEPG